MQSKPLWILAFFLLLLTACKERVGGECQQEMVGPEVLPEELLKQAGVEKCLIKTEAGRVLQEMAYNDQGLKTLHIWYDSVQREAVREEYGYQQGLLDKVNRFHKGEQYAITDYTYSEEGRRMEKLVQTNRRRVVDAYAYDEAGCLSRVDKIIYDLTNEDSVIYRAHYTYHHNGEGRRQFKEWYSSNGKLHAKWRYTYDEADRLVEERFLNANFQDQGRQSYQYSEDGRLLLQDNGRQRWVYQYGPKGLASQAEITYSVGRKAVEQYDYRFR